MKKKLLTLMVMCFINASNGCFAADALNKQDCATSYNQDCTVSYGYVSVGVGPSILMPSIGTGYRTRNYSRGVDSSLRLSTIGILHVAQVNVSMLQYLRPNSVQSYYWGVGPACSFICDNSSLKYSDLLFSPSLVFGKERLEDDGLRGFSEFSFQSPHFLIRKGKVRHATNIPAVYYRYGVCF
ncbi:MAG: hypothetical protein VX777_03000 [Chlamydiota bacterium]|nr:hypothetical protein [Chlamydiota bacterium]